jgi:acetyltransferase-like isoleucine patch superfamily enzyme
MKLKGDLLRQQLNKLDDKASHLMRVAEAELFGFKYKILFKEFGSRSRIYKPLKIRNKHNITISHHVTIEAMAWIEARSHSNSVPSLSIHHHTTIGHFSHIYATNNIIIESNVLIADKAFITDCTHIYESPSLPIACQGVKPIGQVVIGEGSWIGESVSILGASVGKHCVIGAHSVVTRSVPDYCIAAGAPAKIIRYRQNRV